MPPRAASSGSWLRSARPIWGCLLLLLLAHLARFAHLASCEEERGAPHACADLGPIDDRAPADAPTLEHAVALDHDCLLCAACLSPAPAALPTPLRIGPPAAAPTHAGRLAAPRLHLSRAPPGPIAPRAPPLG